MHQRLSQQLVFCLTFTTMSLVTACEGEAVRTREAAQPQRAGVAQQASFDVDAIIRQVHFAYREEGEGWRGGHSTYDVKAAPEGLTLTPVRYRQSAEQPEEVRRGYTREALAPRMEAERGAPLVLGPAQVTRGSTRLSVGRPRGQVELDGHLALVREALVEHVRNSEQGVEQSWSFEAAPRGRGELRVRIPVRGLVHTGTTASGLHFADARTSMGFTYGHGTWVDGKGQRTAVPAEYADGAIHLRVPEQVLTASAYPAVLDPVITPELIIDGRHVSADTVSRLNPVLAFNGTDYLLVWRSLRGGTYDLFATRVSSTGTVLDPEGIPVNNGPGDAASPQVASNGTDFFVVWIDGRTNSWVTYGTLVTAAGVVVNPGGKALAVNQQFHLSPRVASNGTDFLAVWQGLATATMDVFGRRISSAGQPLGTSEFTISGEVSVEERAPSVASNGTDYLVAWEDERDNFTARAYASRVSSSGVVLDAPGFPLSINDFQSTPVVGSNGTDFLVVWLDWRNSTSRDLYGTRVSSSGSVVDGTGLVIGAHVNYSESAPSVAANGTDYFVAWTEWDSANSTRRILGSRLEGSLSVTSPVVDTTSLAFTSGGGNCQVSSVAPATPGYFLAWQCAASPGDELQSAWVSLTGTITAGSGFTVTTSPLHQTEPAIASNGSNYLVVWTETGPGGMSIYGTRVATTGGALDRGGFVIGTGQRERMAPAVASDGTDYLVAWMDYRDLNWDIHGARVLGSGASSSAVLDPNGIVISAHADYQNVPSVASDGTDYLVVWRVDPSARGDIYGARVSSSGMVLDTSGIAIATNLVEHYTPRAASNGTNYLVIWAENDTSSTGWDIRGARVSTGGVVLDTPSIAIASYPNAQYDPAVTSNGSDYFAVWTDYLGGNNHDIYGARVSGAGVVLDTSGIAICTNGANQYVPEVTFDGTSYVTAWVDYRDNPVWDVYASQVTASGSVVTLDGELVAQDVRSYEEGVALASAGDQQSLLVYSSYDTEPSTGSRRIRGRFVSY
jgi:hypothetical protein